MKKLSLLLLVLAMILTVSACSANGSEQDSKEQSPASDAPQESNQSDDQKASDDQVSNELTDQEVADQVAAMIDAIYVQQRTDQTDQQCADAKAAWDALTESQKSMVEGDSADPDYFGRDTGDVSLDDPLNSDNIGDNELLVVSFGTSFNGSRAEDIGGIEKTLQEAYPEWAVRRAFTAQVIINHVQARDGEKIDNVEQALDRAVANGVKNLVLQPTHLMHGAEYDELMATLEGYQDQFESVKVSEPLLGQVGADATVINQDKKDVAVAITAAAVKEAGYDSLEAAKADGVAFVFMGHGTAHTANVTYNQMQTQMAALGYDNVYVGTVEGEPENTACDVVIDEVKEAGYTKVILRPMMVVAGDHANNDMAGPDEDSWKSQFEASNHFESVEPQISGLGRIPEVEAIYVAHTKIAIEDEALESDASSTDNQVVSQIADGVYSADFITDSGMFHANEAHNGKGVLTVENGQMTFHVSLTSQKIQNLYKGSAKAAQDDEAGWLQPSLDKVTYGDGTSEEVHGFDVPVSAVDQDFELAILGSKGKWYDHTVSIANIEPVQ